MSQQTDHPTVSTSTEKSHNEQTEINNIINNICMLSNNINKKVYISPDDEKEVYLILHYQRMATHFSAITLLAEQQMQHQVEILTRSLLELTFNFISYYLDSDFCEAMTTGTDEQHRKVLQKLYDAQQTKPTFTQAELEQLKVMISSAENIQRADIPVFVKAELAGLLNEYRTTYQLLSESVHGSLHSLAEDLEIDEDTKTIIGITPKTTAQDNLATLLLTASDYMLMCIDIMLRMFKQLSEYKTTLHQCSEELHEGWRHHIVKVPHRQTHIN